MRIAESGKAQEIKYQNSIGSGIRLSGLTKTHFKGSDFTVTDLEMLRKADITACNADELVDLRKVTVKTEMPSGERTGDYIRQIKNPYLFRIDSTAVKIEFGSGKDFSVLMTDAILAGQDIRNLQLE